MATEVKVNLAVSDNGTVAQVTNSTKKLNSELEKAKKNASGIRPAGQTAAVSGANTDIEANRLAKGISGASGAAGRDFAKQAQGLGGLVHVYATFAANLFAVSAAFNALSKAADYSNMVEGLNQLGAASGKNLGTMAKNMVALTDGAVSLRQAMEATAQATAGGMSGANLEKMTLVAKKASQALGRDMGDSLTRLSRGITKLEPELLDELGIMVRVDKASQDYALSLGKTVTSLTDFEKRQGFANAVLDQGMKKFGGIEIDANPYQKLLASFTNIALVGGELINKVLGPIAKILSESPSALAVAMAGIAGTLLKQAIPAITQWRKGLVDAAKEASQRAKEISKAHQDFMIAKPFQESAEQLKPLREQAGASVTAIRDAITRALPETSKLVKATISDSFMADPKVIEKNITSYKAALTRAETTLRSSEGSREEAKKAGKEALAALNQRILKEKEAVGQIALSVIEAQKLLKIRKEEVAILDKAEAKGSKEPGFLSMEASLARKAASASKAAANATIYSQIGQDTQFMGMGQAWQNAKKNIKDNEEALGKWGSKVTAVSAGARILGSGILNVASSLGQIGMVVGLVSAGFAILDGVFSKNSKQMEEFNNAAEQNKESLLGLSRTLDYIASQDAFGRLSTSSIQASANAINEVTASATKLIGTFEAASKNAGLWDNFWNGFSDAWNGDKERKLADNLAESISRVMSTITDEKQLASMKAKLIEAGASKDTSQVGLKNRLDELANKGQLDTIKKINKVAEEYSQKVNNVAANLSSFADSTNTAEKSMQSLMASFIPSDPMSKFGIDQIAMANRLAKAINDGPTSALTAFAETASDINRLKLMPTEVQDYFIANAAAIKQAQAELADYTVGLQFHQQKVTELQAKGYGKGSGFTHSFEGKKVEGTVAYGEAARSAEFLSKKVEERQEAAIKYVKNISGMIYDDGAKKLTLALSTALAQGSIDVQKNLAKTLGGTAGAQAEGQLAQQEISIQIEAVKVQKGIITTTQELTLRMERSNLLAEQKLEQEKSGGGDTSKLAKLKTGLEANEEASTFFQKNKANLFEALKTKKDKEGNITQSASDNVKMALGDTATKLIGSDIQLAKLRSQAEIAADNTKLKVISEVYKLQKDLTQDEIAKVQRDQSSLDTMYKSLGVYSDIVEDQKATNAEKIQELEINKIVLQYGEQLSALQYTLLKYGKQSLLGKAAEARMSEVQAEQDRKLNEQRSKFSEAELKRIQERADAELAYRQKVLELEDRIKTAVGTTRKEQADARKGSIDKQLSAGSITGTKALDLKLEQDLVSAQVDAEKAIRDKVKAQLQENSSLQSKINIQIASLAKDHEAGVFSEAKAAALSEALILQGKSIEANKQEMLQVENSIVLKKGLIEIEAKYQKALVKTEETLKKIETTGGSVTDYAGAMYQDFSNKVADLVKNTKSAASAFNEGFIQAIDTSIDKFFEMLQTGTLNMKDMVKFVRNSLSDVFRDYAANTIKNTWKSLMAQVLPPSDEIKAAREQVSATNRLIKALEDNTASKNGSTGGITGYSPSGGTTTSAGGDISQENYDILKNMDVSGSSEDIKDASTVQKTASKGFFDSAIGFGKGVYDFITGADRSTTGMSKIIENFGNMMPSLFTGIYGAISSAMSMSSSGSDGGGIFGTILKAGIGYLTGGWSGVATSLISSVDGPWTSTNPVVDSQAGIEVRDLVTQAKGGVWHGSASLSAHSNSIVDSPTLFAFAKGAGLMGEAGPEAIMPLKRDSQGNLGIRGGSGDTNNNNISINITVEGGTAKDSGGDRSTQNAMASQLGAAIKAAVSDELIKQSRPGGLLARR